VGVWEDPVRYVESIQFAIDIPNKGETCHAMMALESLLILLYDNPTLQQSKRDLYYRVRNQMAKTKAIMDKHGFIALTMELNELGSEFLRCFTIRNSTISFDSTTMASSPIYSTIRLLDCKESDHTYLETNQILIRWVYTWHVFLAKVPISRPDLFDSATQAWILRQMAINAFPFNYGAICDDLAQLRSIIGWLIEVDEFDLPGKHGPGSTASKAKTIKEKNAIFRHSIQSSQLTPYAAIEDALPPLDAPPDARYIEVFKDCKSVRPITAEDAAMQYSQQSLKMKLYHTTDFSDDLPIRHFVKYSDQMRSRARTLFGSKFRRDDSSPATIDLSNASDYLSLELVINLFQGNLLHQLCSGRSWGADVKGQRVEFGMYAGMGSALTFPVQTLVFSAIAILATIKSLHAKEDKSPFNFDLCKSDYLDMDGFRHVYKKYGRSIQIYGDDIIVPEIAVSETILLLGKLGLRVNVAKSFKGDDGVRESCGMFALGGEDITPLRFRIPVVNNNGSLDFAAYEALRSLINRSFFYDYKHLYRFLVRKLKTTPLLVSNNEYKRIASVIGKKPNELLLSDYILFEEYIGEEHEYLGIVSMRSPVKTHKVRTFEELEGKFTPTGVSKVDEDSTSEFYHLTYAYTKMYIDDSHSQDHGRIPRGIRLVFDNAVLNPVKGLGASYMAWRLAPKLDKGFET
jgi:hypothetical protein